MEQQQTTPSNCHPLIGAELLEDSFSQKDEFVGKHIDFAMKKIGASGGRIKKAFWLVWRVGGQHPTRKHETQEDAALEAKRLSALHPGVEFAVLQCVCSLQSELAPPKYNVFV